MAELDGKAAIVTGASKGIGAGIAGGPVLTVKTSLPYFGDAGGSITSIGSLVSVPGAAETRGTQRMGTLGDEIKGMVVAITPMGRIGEPSDFAAQPSSPDSPAVGAAVRAAARLSTA